LLDASGIDEKTMTAPKSTETVSSGKTSDHSRRPMFDEDIGFQRRQWRVERFGWAAMVLVIIAALAGVLGGGGIVELATASDSTSLTEVRYARFARYSSSTTLEVNVTASASGRPMRLSISDQYLGAMNVRAITPSPISTSIASRQHVFVFDRAASAAATIRFELVPQSIGRHEGWIAVDGAAPVFFSHFVYP